MSQSHTPLVPLNLGESSKAAYALSGATIAIVFLHGYSGTAVGTWKQFDSLLFDFPPAENADLFFVGYESTTRATEASAYFFFQVLDALFTKAAAARRPSSIPGNRIEPYRKIVVVAHSMGSVVVRRALLLADVDQHMWTKNVAMVFFAPAHLGARFHNYVDSAVAGIFKLIWEFGQFRSPAINELRIDSPYLAQLRDDVTNALQKVSCFPSSDLIHSTENVYTTYPDNRRDAWERFWPQLRGFSLSLLKAETGLSRRMLIKARNGQVRPHPRNQKLLTDALKKIG